MIINIDQNVFIVIVFQTLLAITLYCKKPYQLFNSDGSVKSYGTGKDQTLYPVFLVISSEIAEDELKLSIEPSPLNTNCAAKVSTFLADAKS